MISKPNGSQSVRSRIGIWSWSLKKHKNALNTKNKSEIFLLLYGNIIKDVKVICFLIPKIKFLWLFYISLIKLRDSEILAFFLAYSFIKFLWMLTLWRRIFFNKWSMIQGHIRPLLCKFHSSTFVYRPILMKICMNANIKTQYFHKIKHDLKCHFYVMEKFCDFFKTFRPNYDLDLHLGFRSWSRKRLPMTNGSRLPCVYLFLELNF